MDQGQADLGDAAACMRAFCRGVEIGGEGEAEEGKEEHLQGEKQWITCKGEELVSRERTEEHWEQKPHWQDEFPRTQ